MKHTPQTLINIARIMHALALSKRDYNLILFNRIDGELSATSSDSETPIHIDPTISDPDAALHQLPLAAAEHPEPIWNYNLQTRRRLALAIACAIAAIKRDAADTVSITNKSVLVYSYDAELDAAKNILLHADKVCAPTARQELRNPYNGKLLGNLELTLYKTITA